MKDGVKSSHVGVYSRMIHLFRTINGAYILDALSNGKSMAGAFMNQHYAADQSLRFFPRLNAIHGVDVSNSPQVSRRLDDNE